MVAGAEGTEALRAETVVRESVVFFKEGWEMRWEMDVTLPDT